MAKRPSAPPSRVRGRGSRESGVDVRGWLGAIRLSGFTAIMLGLVILAAFVLVPTASTYLEQRQRIAFLQEAVQVSQDKVDALERERSRWQDPAYITTQARERLFYGFPGEVVYIVDDDLDESEQPVEPEPISAEVEETEHDWMSQMLRSVVSAGLTKTAVSEEEVVEIDGDVFQPDTSTDQ
ncbi:septum formation initiator family protein [Microbacterium oryzae]|uniref:Septum formation initiator family protein n=1 Tax=Microbacterium oryzae TaxID=743009 RepID=A0A6I6DNS1_9MICO|nr:septum formation initiator family protein [Microbacterium oryzae]QGU26452.1 septum formation initiator family protein [Microbacterium oryzae]